MTLWDRITAVPGHQVGEASRLFKAWSELPHLTRRDWLRLSARIANGASPHRAAVAEYAYRLCRAQHHRGAWNGHSIGL